MRTEARKTLSTIHTIQRLEDYVRCARAELASCPEDELLREFIRINERLILEEKRRLLDVA
ncbi:hypothetical protein [Tahibacter amnicola]|uniref:Uncharacterized protein n=1 Tax=Tahibacter amnicola TaxID=2976241 RepID=A0ABY6BJA8_9GAMM|nr:hypothetical protein [Tahibacter amnicola]UXI69849.1 hypothetical protein N4264_09545 [Tahibacter amnicola]